MGAYATSSIQKTPDLSFSGSSLERNISALAPLAFTASDRALQASQAVAVLAASDYIEDSIVDGDGNTYSRVIYDKSTEDDKKDFIFQIYPSIFGVLTSGKNLAFRTDGSAFVYDPSNAEISYDVNPLIYKSKASDTEQKYWVQVDGEFLSIGITEDDGKFEISSSEETSMLINSDKYTTFAETNNITANTKLGATIVLKTLLMNEGYFSTELDSTFIDIQPDYLAFIEKTITPGLDSELTAVSSGIKAAIDFLKKIIQKASQ